MKRNNYFTAMILLSLLPVSFATAQNLIANCSFEQYDTCPDNETQIQRAIGWFKTTYDADYYNSCSPDSNWSVPPSFQYQLAASGNAMAGALFYIRGYSTGEIIHTQLSAPLTVGITYYVSFKVNLCLTNAPQSNLAIDKLGAKFTTSGMPAINNMAHVYSNSVITDTMNWTTISGSFVADSAYTTLYLGVFFDTSNVIWQQLAPTVMSDRAYYFIDDVCVSTNPNDICLPVGISEIEFGRGINIFPNPASSRLNFFFPEAGNYFLTIKNTLGETILVSAIREQTFSVDIKDFPAGGYFVTVTDEKKNRMVKKFVKM
jgi:hypothetical protein